MLNDPPLSLTQAVGDSIGQFSPKKQEATMYYIVENTHSDRPGLTVLASCRTPLGARRRLSTLRQAYRKNYGYNTIFPSLPYPMKADEPPTAYNAAQAHEALGDIYP